MESQVPRRGQWRLCRIDWLQRHGEQLEAWVCDRGYRYRARGRSSGCKLGLQASGEGERLRLPCSARNDRECEKAGRSLLWPWRGALLFRQLLRWWTRGADGSSALSGGFRRYSRRRTRELLDPL